MPSQPSAPNWTPGCNATDSDEIDTKEKPWAGIAAEAKWSERQDWNQTHRCAGESADDHVPFHALFPSRQSSGGCKPVFSFSCLSSWRVISRNEIPSRRASADPHCRTQPVCHRCGESETSRWQTNSRLARNTRCHGFPHHGSHAGLARRPGRSRNHSLPHQTRRIVSADGLVHSWRVEFPAPAEMETDVLAWAVPAVFRDWGVRSEFWRNSAR